MKPEQSLLRTLRTANSAKQQLFSDVNCVSLFNKIEHEIH